MASITSADATPSATTANVSRLMVVQMRLKMKPGLHNVRRQAIAGEDVDQQLNHSGVGSDGTTSTQSV